MAGFNGTMHVSISFFVFKEQRAHLVKFDLPLQVASLYGVEHAEAAHASNLKVETGV